MQLTVLGYILVPIFDLNAWWLNILYMLFMLGVAAAEAISRPPAAYNVCRTPHHQDQCSHHIVPDWV